MEVFCFSSVFSYKLFQLVSADMCGCRTSFIFARIEEEKKEYVMNQFKLIMMNTSNTEIFAIDWVKSVIFEVGKTPLAAHIAYAHFTCVELCVKRLVT